MNPERLLQNFDRLIETPDAVPRLRRFILDLAVRGKLVEQNPEDEPAAELLKRIEAEKKQMVKEDKIKKQVPTAKCQNNELRFELPMSWVWSSLGDVSQYGLPDKVDSNKQITSGTWVLDLEDIEKDTSRLIERVFSDDRPFKSTKTRFKHGDVLFGKLRPYLNKVVVADEDGVCTTEIVPIRGFCGLASEYIKLVLKSPLTMERVNQMMYGMKMPRIGTNDAITLNFPLPPLAEQHRIVAKVDELMKLCDELETAQAKRERRRDNLVAATLHGLNNSGADSETIKQLPFKDSARFYFNHLPRLTTRPEHIQQLRHTILNLAVRGKLVLQYPKDEPAVELLRRIAEEKKRLVATGKIKKCELAPNVKATDVPYESPRKWLWVRWDAIAMKIGDIDHKMPETASLGIPYVSPRDFLPDNKINFESAKTISETDFIRLSAKIKPEQGDLIYPRYGTIGENRLVQVQRDFLASYSCAVIKVLQGFICPMYQYFFSISDVARDQAKAAENKATQANVGIKSIKEFYFPLPPLAEQHRIVEKVDELMALCDEMEGRINTNTTTSRKFLEATLQEAINGQNELQQGAVL